VIREKRNKINTIYSDEKSATRKKGLEFHIAKFQEIVSQGPLYMCTCCDQLSYKHSIVRADVLKQCNPKINKHLCRRTGIDSRE